MTEPGDDVTTNTCAGQRCTNPRRKADRIQRGVNLHGDPRPHEVVGGPHRIGVDLGYHPAGTLFFSHEGKCPRGQSLIRDEDIGPLAEDRTQ